jgi:hypothetical protein
VCSSELQLAAASYGLLLAGCSCQWLAMARCGWSVACWAWPGLVGEVWQRRSTPSDGIARSHPPCDSEDSNMKAGLRQGRWREGKKGRAWAAGGSLATVEEGTAVSDMGRQ